MKFIKKPSCYVATRFDGQVITVQRAEEGSEWVVYYDDDHYGDNTGYFPTKREAVAFENNNEACLMEDTQCNEYP